MRKMMTVMLVLVLLTSLLVGCNSAVSKPEDNKLSVYASFYPLYDFARKVGGDKIQLTNMIPAGAGAHDWEPAAADIANLEDADVFVYNGAGLEHWVGTVLSSLRNEQLIVVETTAGIPLLDSHQEAMGEGTGHEDGGCDPHVWLDPQNAKRQMESIKNALVEADSANREFYEANYVTYAAEFDRLDQEYEDVLSVLPHRSIVVAHQAFGYLCAAYGLTQEAIEGLSPDSEPDPARMAEIIEFAQDHDVRVVFFEELASPKVAETIASAIGAKIGVLNPLGGLSDDQQVTGDDYFSVMRQNLQALQAALR